MLIDVPLLLPEDALARLEALAAARNATPGEIIRDLVERELGPDSPSAPPKALKADEQLVARLQRLLAPTMASATSWPDLEHRLARQGYALRPARHGLTLHTAEGLRLCKASELGFSYTRLVERFGGPIPGASD